MFAAAIARALAGCGGFSLVAANGAVPVPRRAFAARRRGLVLWPLANTAQALWQLLHAVDAGIVPVLLPGDTPAGRLELLRQRYRGFGIWHDQTIDWPAAPAPCPPGVALGLLTSGSTGEPKVIATAGDRLLAGIRAIHAAQDLDAAPSTAVVLPLAYSFALVNQALWAVVMERELHFPGALTDPAGVVDRLQQRKTAMLCLVAHQARLFARLGATGEAALADVSRVNFAGAPFPVAELPALRRCFPAARFFNNYGCAEAMPRLTCREVLPGDGDATRVGAPIGDIRLRLRDGNAGPAVEFNGSSTALGTLADDGRLVPFAEWIASGDLGQLENGELRLLGRHDQVVKIGGERYSLVPVETACTAWGASNALAWIETSGPREAVALLVNCPEPPPLKTLIPWLRSRLPRPLLPHAIYWTPEWRHSANGKSDRAALKTAAQSGALPRLWPPG